MNQAGQQLGALLGRVLSPARVTSVTVYTDCGKYVSIRLVYSNGKENMMDVPESTDQAQLKQLLVTSAPNLHVVDFNYGCH